MTQDEFIKQASLLWHDKFDYSLVEYKGSKVKVTIICPVHGKFRQVPNGHLQGRDCAKCSRGVQDIWNDGRFRR